MATVAKNSQGTKRAGLGATYHADLTATDTFEIPNDGKTVLHVKKSGAGACNVSIAVKQKVDGITPAPRVVAIPATTGDKFIGPFPIRVYGSSIDVTFSEVTGLTMAILRLGDS